MPCMLCCPLWPVTELQQLLVMSEPTDDLQPPSTTADCASNLTPSSGAAASAGASGAKVTPCDLPTERTRSVSCSHAVQQLLVRSLGSMLLVGLI